MLINKDFPTLSEILSKTSGKIASLPKLKNLKLLKQKHFSGKTEAYKLAKIFKFSKWSNNYV